jgi:lipoate-protein ligase A
MPADTLTNAAEELDWLAARVREPLQFVQVAFCHYREPAMIFGLSQRPDAQRLRQLAERGVPGMRRRAGGGTVFAGPWLLGASVILPATHPLYRVEPVAGYRWFGGLWQAALADIGCPSVLAHTERLEASRLEARRLGIDWACFGAMGHGELASAAEPARKLLGIAQIRTRAAVTLVAGLTLATVDWHALCALLDRDPGEAAHLAARNVSVQECLAGPRDIGRLARDIQARFQQHLDTALRAGPDTGMV